MFERVEVKERSLCLFRVRREEGYADVEAACATESGVKAVGVIC